MDRLQDKIWCKQWEKTQIKRLTRHPFNHFLDWKVEEVSLIIQTIKDKEILLKETLKTMNNKVFSISELSKLKLKTSLIEKQIKFLTWEITKIQMIKREELIPIESLKK